MDPVSALERISFLLERNGADTHKVRAFRNALLAIRELSDEELLALANGGRLQSIPGIGKSTAQAITEALRGGVPAYLARLEAEPEPFELNEPARELLRQLRGDCHSHSDWSDGGSSIREMAEAARDLGHEYLAMTDHSPRLKVAHGLDTERLMNQLELIASLNDELTPFRIFTGIEVDILDDGSLDQEESVLSQLDVVVASVHSNLRMDRRTMTRRMLAAIENPNMDILGHCTGRLIMGKGRPQSDFDAKEVFDQCVRTDTAVEINARPEREDPPEDLLRLAVEAGCTFSIDTDAHAPGQLDWLGRGCINAVRAGVAPEHVVNRLTAQELLAWTAAHEG